MNDAEILDQVRRLVDEEHDLRSRREAGGLDATEERRRLETVEESLDQCWDLLRQRRARREAGQNPDEAGVRPVSEVEDYLQ